MKFTREFLQEELDRKNIISNEVYDRKRWYVIYRCIFKHEDKFYEWFYDSPATECQELDYPDEYECKEVFPKEKVVIYYE